MSVSNVTWLGSSNGGGGLPPEEQAPEESQKICDECGKTEGKLSLCSRCQLVYYCSPQCLKTAWKTHRSTCKPTILLDAAAIEEWVAQGSMRRFPANSRIKIKDIPEIDFKKYKNLAATGSVTMQEIFHFLKSTLNNILMIEHRTLGSLSFSGMSYLQPLLQDDRRVLIFGSDQPFDLSIIKPGTIMGYASYLLEKLMWRDQSEFTISGKEQLYLYDISAQEISFLLQNPQQLLPWLLSKAPDGADIVIEGGVGLNRSLIRMGDNDTEFMPAIVLTGPCTLKFNWKSGKEHDKNWTKMAFIPASELFKTAHSKTAHSKTAQETAQVGQATICAVCGAIEAQLCSRCHKVSYCNVTCQRKHWPEHKKVCGVAEKVLPAVDKKELLVFDSTSFAEWATPGETHILPAHREILFEHIPPEDHHKLLQQALERKSDEVYDPFKQSAADAALTSVLNNFLMMHKRKLKEIRYYWRWGVNDESPILKINGQCPIHITVAEGEMEGYLSFFLKEMRRLRRTEFSLSKGETIYWMDVKEESRKVLIEEPARFSHLLNWIVRQDGKVSFLGPQLLFRLPIRNSEILPGLLIEAREDCKFEFSWPEQ